MIIQTIKTLKPHISLNVKNIADSVAFYKALFGSEPVKFIKGESTTHSAIEELRGDSNAGLRTGYAKFDLSSPPLNLVLNEAPFSSGGTLSHLGIQVDSTDDVLKFRERWAAGGLMTADEMNVDCCYALQDKTWARDPDGNEWEAFVVLENTEEASEPCACGSKVQEAKVSAAVCCTETPKTSTIGATSAPCC